MSNSTSSSTSSDEEMEGRAKRKRKWKDLFETLMKEVVNKQEDLQKRFLEAIEKREHERMAREEAWRMQEMASINHEREILAQERSIAAVKDAAVMSFLQQIAEQQHNPQATPPTNLNNHLVTSQTPQPPSVQQSVAPPPPHPQRQQTTPPAALQITQAPVTTFEITPRANGENNNGDNNNLVSPTTTPTSSRWPRVEIHSLINLRTSLDSKYQENVPKGPLWEEISAGMKKLGYNRSAKRCKEKWENINKYFKKVKERNKKRPEDSKTCPYFHLLDSLYRERNHKFDHHKNGNSNNNNADNVNNSTKPENAAPVMVRPEQQWQPPTNQENEEEEREGDEDEEDDDEEDEGNYEIVANKGASVSVGATAAQ